MAVFKIFSEKDAFIWSEQLTQNMGRDEILEISTYNDPDIVNSNLSFIPSVTRALIKFPQSQIDPLLDTIISQSITRNQDWNVYLQLYLANASNLPQTYILLCNAVSQSWEMGTGRLADRPRTTDGVSWTYRLSSASNAAWQTSSFQTNVTSSDNGIPGQRGGGNWFINPVSVRGFNYISNKDITFPVKPIVERWHSHSLHPGVYPEAFGNEGFIIRYTGSQEFNTASIQQLSYFSMDTHTIYPPSLTFKWDDHVFDSGSSPTISNNQFITTIGNIMPEIPSRDVYRFNVYSRDQYPPRSFQTQSVYLNTKLLPTASCWALKDVITGEMVVDFDLQYTKLSSNPTCNYFDVYMNGLEPERYYQILIQTTIGDQTITVDNPDYYFKLVR
jgi:hypothetical protein